MAPDTQSRLGSDYRLHSAGYFYRSGCHRHHLPAHTRADQSCDGGGASGQHDVTPSPVTIRKRTRDRNNKPGQNKKPEQVQHFLISWPPSFVFGLGIVGKISVAPVIPSPVVSQAVVGQVACAIARLILGNKNGTGLLCRKPIKAFLQSRPVLPLRQLSRVL